MARHPKARLTRREQIVMELMAEGKSQEEIAEQTNTHPFAVSQTTRRIYNFCGAKSKRQQVIEWWEREGREQHQNKETTT